MATRFASERWILIQHKGQKWVEEAISEMTNRLANTGIARTGRISLRWCSMRIATARGYLRCLASWIIKRKQPRELLPIVEPPRPRTRPRITPSNPLASCVSSRTYSVFAAVRGCPPSLLYLRRGSGVQH
ncbi:hypothetical protein JVT61DRAFT_5110 [Boletus reticuloceps]|uniref:Uncharacterized protein n=1 Tax=Boletus reticuloceps TaxID=495285 RepID=A0A8I2YYZ7_9AGAM|nr:hypothetical protein JVT61DRAFT_5110 [Boletus reticuloceps]